MRSISNEKRAILILSLVSVILLWFPLLSYGEYTYYDAITAIDLGVKELKLRVGETYTFKLTHKPEETPDKFISWLTDDSVLQTDPEHFSVTAVSAGKTRLLVESNAGFAWDYCDVTVSGGQENVGSN